MKLEESQITPMETDRERPSGGASTLMLSELPGTFIQNLVCNYLDPGLRLSLRETCTVMRCKVDAYSTPCCRLGGSRGLDRFLVLSQVSDGVQQLDVSQVDADLSCAAAEAQLPAAAWQKLRQLTCHCKQMVLVKTLVECSPKQLTSIIISARRGNWQHAGLLLQQLQRLRCLNSLELALPPQHKLDELLAGLTQLRALTLTAAPRSSQHGGHWPLIPLLGASSSRSAKVDAAFWRSAIAPLTQLTSLQLALPFCGTASLQLQPLSRLAALHCCCAREQLPDLLEQLPALQALTSLALDAKVGRRLSPAALVQQGSHALDLAPLGQLTRLVELQVNVQQPLDLAALLPLAACSQLALLGVSRLHLTLPWRGAELSPACAAAADAAEAGLVAAVMAGQADVALAQVLLTKPGAAHAAPLNVEGVSGMCLPLLPALEELRVCGVAGRLPLAVLGPGVSELCIQGCKRVWSHQRGVGAADDQMDALMDVLAAGPAGGGGPAQVPAAAQLAGAAGGAVAGMGPFAPLAAAAAGGGGIAPQDQAGAAAAGGPAALAAAGAAAAAPGAPPEPGQPAAQAAGVGGFAGFHGSMAAGRMRAAAAQAELLAGLGALQALDLNFTQLCGICLSPTGGRALLHSIVSLTVLMRGSGSVPGGVPHMPRLRRLCFYDDYDLRMPGRPLVASYDQKEDHQLWINQRDLQEITLAGSYILGGFFDGNALLHAKAQFRRLQRWVFKDCSDLSAGHLAALLAVRVAPVVALEGSSVLSHNDVRQLVALNPVCGVDVQWAAHAPPQPVRDSSSSEFMAGVMGLDMLPPWDPAGAINGPQLGELEEQMEELEAGVQQAEDEVAELFPPPWAAAAQQQQQQGNAGPAAGGGGGIFVGGGGVGAACSADTYHNWLPVAAGPPPKASPPIWAAVAVILFVHYAQVQPHGDHVDYVPGHFHYRRSLLNDQAAAAPQPLQQQQKEHGQHPHHDATKAATKSTKAVVAPKTEQKPAPAPAASTVAAAASAVPEKAAGYGGGWGGYGGHHHGGYHGGHYGGYHGGYGGHHNGHGHGHHWGRKMQAAAASTAAQLAQHHVPGHPEHTHTNTDVAMPVPASTSAVDQAEPEKAPLKHKPAAKASHKTAAPVTPAKPAAAAAVPEKAAVAEKAAHYGGGWGRYGGHRHGGYHGGHNGGYHGGHGGHHNDHGHGHHWGRKMQAAAASTAAQLAQHHVPGHPEHTHTNTDVAMPVPASTSAVDQAEPEKAPLKHKPAAKASHKTAAPVTPAKPAAAAVVPEKAAVAEKAAHYGGGWGRYGGHRHGGYHGGHNGGYHGGHNGGYHGGHGGHHNDHGHGHHWGRKMQAAAASTAAQLAQHHVPGHPEHTHTNTDVAMPVPASTSAKATKAVVAPKTEQKPAPAPAASTVAAAASAVPEKAAGYGGGWGGYGGHHHGGYHGGHYGGYHGGYGGHHNGHGHGHHWGRKMQAAAANTAAQLTQHYVPGHPEHTHTDGGAATPPHGNHYDYVPGHYHYHDGHHYNGCMVVRRNLLSSATSCSAGTVAKLVTIMLLCLAVILRQDGLPVITARHYFTHCMLVTHRVLRKHVRLHFKRLQHRVLARSCLMYSDTATLQASYLPLAIVWPHKIRMITYNILADKYSSFNAYCPPQYLAWQYRCPRLLAELEAYAADLLFLQEVESTVFDQQLRPWMQQRGYQSLFHPRRSPQGSAGPDEGVSLHFRASAFTHISSAGVRLGDASLAGPLLPAACCSKHRHNRFLQALSQREEGCLLALLRHKPSQQQLLAVSTHLFWNPLFPDVKVAQAALLCSSIAAFLQRHGLEPGQVPLAVGGDFNSMWQKYSSDQWDQLWGGSVDSSMETGSAEGSLDEDAVAAAVSGGSGSRSRRGTRSRAGKGSSSSSLVDYSFHTSQLQLDSSYHMAHGREPPLTTRTSRFSGTLDYLWLSRQHWRVASTLAMPYSELPAAAPPESVADLPPCPNEVMPSDHLAVGCEALLLPVAGW
ncbi:hypothetical protein COO60DRAFT_1628447 [Scenedesmus sp. NREL 46B-D3]|nr:hypothetical protein COO60DRAFT_1628447 [Scenedesmus sp. NREL 46B-D3]